MASYSEIQVSVRTHDGFVPKPCWIADVKRQEGLPVRRAANRQGDSIKNLCPAPKRAAIRRALVRLGDLPH